MEYASLQPSNRWRRWCPLVISLETTCWSCLIDVFVYHSTIPGPSCDAPGMFCFLKSSYLQILETNCIQNLLFWNKSSIFASWWRCYRIFNSYAPCNGSKTYLFLHLFSSAAICWREIIFGQRWSCLPRFVWYRVLFIVSTTCGMWKQTVSILRNVPVLSPLGLSVLGLVTPWCWYAR